MTVTTTSVRVTLGKAIDASPKTVCAQSIALGLMGAGNLDPNALAADVTWQKGRDVAVGDQAVRAAITGDTLLSVRVDETVLHGKAAAVSGQFTTHHGVHLFCHMIKFTSASAKQVASIVSFTHPPKGRKS